MHHSVFLRAAFLFLVTTLTGAADAQGVLELPSVLRDMPRVGSMCKNDRLPDLEEPGKAIAARRVQAACVLRVSEIADFLQKKEPAVIDAGNEAEFSQFHISNAMRLDAASLRTRGHLRNKAILLVGDGKADRRLYEVCSELRSRGFRSVQVMAGGMTAYLAQGLPVNGQRPPSAAELAHIDASQAWAQSQFPESIVLVAKGSVLAEVLPRVQPIASVTPSSVRSAVERQRKQRGERLVNVVLAVEAPFDEETFLKYSRAVAPVPLLIYAGGSGPMKAFLAAQQTVWSNHQRGPRQPRCG